MVRRRFGEVFGAYLFLYGVIFGIFFLLKGAFMQIID